MKCLFGLLLAALLLVGCGEEDDPTRNNDYVPLTAITVTSAATTIPAGFSNQFIADGNFSDAFLRPVTTEATWTSSDPTVLVFENPDSGLGRAIRAGTVTISATRSSLAGGAGEPVTGTMEFTVNDATLSSIAVTTQPVGPLPVSVPKGRTQQFVATGTFSNASSLVITSEVSWRSSDAAVASVDSNGLAKAEAVGGPVTITAGYPKDAVTPAVTGTAQMTVTAAAAESIRLTPTPPILTIGETHQFIAELVLSDGTTSPAANATWSSNTPAVATINTATGLATTVGIGETIISATASGFTGQATLTVGTIASIAVTPSDPAADLSIGVGEELQLKAEATFTNNAKRDVTSMATWNSNQTEFASVNPTTGLVTGIAIGTANVTATKVKTGTAAVNVE